MILLKPACVKWLKRVCLTFKAQNWHLGLVLLSEPQICQCNQSSHLLTACLCLCTAEAIPVSQVRHWSVFYRVQKLLVSFTLWQVQVLALQCVHVLSRCRLWYRFVILTYTNMVQSKLIFSLIPFLWSDGGLLFWFPCWEGSKREDPWGEGAVGCPAGIPTKRAAKLWRSWPVRTDFGWTACALSCYSVYWCWPTLSCEHLSLKANTFADISCLIWI